MGSPETSVKIAKKNWKPNPAELIASAIWQDVMDRRDIGQMFRSCEPEVQQHIRHCWAAICQLVLKEPNND